MSCTINVLGVCTSRDIFTFGMGGQESNGYVVGRYLESIDPVSALSKSVAPKELRHDDPELASAFDSLVNFRKRMLEFEINKGAFEYFEAVDSEWLLTDAGSLRFDLFKYEVASEDGDTETAYLETCFQGNILKLCDLGALPQPEAKITLDDVPDEEVDHCLEEYSDWILGLYDEDHIILNEVRPAHFFVDGDKAGAFDQDTGIFDYETVARYAKNTDRGFDFLKKRFPRAHVIEFPRGTMADAQNYWGLHPLHFIPEYYDYGLEAVDIITKGGFSREEERRRLDELKARYEKIIRDKYLPVFAKDVSGLAVLRTSSERHATARVDMKDAGSDDNDLEILGVSDPEAYVDAPQWLNGNGHGHVVCSSAGSLDLRFRCVGDGVLRISFMGLDVRDDNGERIPHWIEYTALNINGQPALSGTKVACCGSPYTIRKEVGDGEEFAISFTWRPFEDGGEFNRLQAENKKLKAANDGLREDKNNLEAERLRLEADLEATSAQLAKAQQPLWRKAKHAVGRAVRKLRRAIGRGKRE